MDPLIIHDPGRCPVYSHVRGRPIDRFSADNPLKDLLKNGKRLDIAVVVDGRLAMGLEVEGVDQVYVAKIGRGRLVSHVDRVHQREVPNRKGLEFRIARMDTVLVIVINLAQASGQLSAARTGTRDHHQRLVGLDVRICAVAVGAHDSIDVGRVSLGWAVAKDRDAAAIELVLELDGPGLIVESSDHHGPQFDTPFAKIVDQFHGVGIVCDAEVGPHLLPLDRPGVDTQENFSLFPQLGQETHLHVWIETGQDSGSVIIEEELSTELQVQFVVKATDAIKD